MSYQRPKITYGAVSFPQQREGSDGDIQIRSTNLGAKLFGKAGGTWYGSPLTSTEGTPIMRMGVTLANHLAISPDKLEFMKGSKSMLSITSDGDINMTGKIILTSTGTQNVCIGTGNNDIGSNNVVIGVDAGNSLVSDCLNNVLIGIRAGENVGDGGASGGLSDENVFIGYQAGRGASSGCTGYENVGIGENALDAFTTGHDNVAIGDEALGVLTTGDYNIGIGTLAGGTIVDGNYNVTIGFGSDCASDTDWGIAIGQAAITQATNSIAIGQGITNATTRTVKFGDGGGSMVSLDWDTSGDSTWVRSSDIRKKKNIKDNTLGLEFVNKLQTRTFQMKPQYELPKEWENYSETNRYDTEKVHIGFIAQELKALIDEYDAPDEVASWSEDPDGMQRAGETKLITPLIKAVQELSTKVDTMQTEINNLKAE